MTEKMYGDSNGYEFRSGVLVGEFLKEKGYETFLFPFRSNNTYAVDSIT